MSTPEPKVPSSPSLSPFTALSQCDANACARDRLFSAAINLFYQNGIRAVSVDAIADEAGTTKVTFYRVFESKDDLIVQVLEEQSRRFWEWWDAIVAEHPGAAAQADRGAHRTVSSRRSSATKRVAAVPSRTRPSRSSTKTHPARVVIKKHKLEIAQRLARSVPRDGREATRRARRRVELAVQRRVLGAALVRRPRADLGRIGSGRGVARLAGARRAAQVTVRPALANEPRK